MFAVWRIPLVTALHNVTVTSDWLTEPSRAKILTTGLKLLTLSNTATRGPERSLAVPTRFYILPCSQPLVLRKRQRQCCWKENRTNQGHLCPEKSSVILHRYPGPHAELSVHNIQQTSSNLSMKMNTAAPKDVYVMPPCMYCLKSVLLKC